MERFKDRFSFATASNDDKEGARKWSAGRIAGKPITLYTTESSLCARVADALSRDGIEIAAWAILAASAGYVGYMIG